MGKGTALHSLLAVEGDLKVVSTKIKNEAITAFTKKDDHFEGLLKIYEALDESAYSTNNTESKELVTTVVEKLEYIKKSIVAGINVQLSKEETNCSGIARAELTVNGLCFGEFSATSLLSLEKEMQQLRSVYSSIPTLDPAKSWKRDEMVEGHVFITEPTKTFRTAKTQDFVTTYEATEHHPAQVQPVVKDVTVGQYLTTYKSGKITPLAKSQMLGRIDDLILGVKVARSKANQADVLQVTVGIDILNYINKDIV